MTLEYRVAKLESDMSDLKSGSLKIPKNSSFSIVSLCDWAFPGLLIWCLFLAFWLGTEVGEQLERRSASHNTPASISGPANSPGHDTVEDPR